MRANLKVIFILLIIGIIFFTGFFYWVKSGEQYLRKNGAKVTGTISQTGGKNVLVSFNYSGCIYTTVVGQQNNTLQDGEMYTVLINKEDTSDCLVDFSDPVFDTSTFTEGKIRALEKLTLSNKIKFDYVEGNENYTRLQALPPNIDFDKLKSKATLFVSKHNPKISYVLFN